MTKFYSKETSGFYLSEMRADYDAAGSWPADAVEVSDADETLIRDGLSSGCSISIKDGQWIATPAPPPTDEQLIAAAIFQRDLLLARATTAIAPLEDAIELDLATAVETALLKAWKRYRVDLNRIQSQSGYPKVIDWPQPPTA